MHSPYIIIAMTIARERAEEAERERLARTLREGRPSRPGVVARISSAVQRAASTDRARAGAAPRL
ncbi:MAG: hypothetical protein ACJ761_01790 [Chloroflexota bacterium]